MWEEASREMRPDMKKILIYTTDVHKSLAGGGGILEELARGFQYYGYEVLLVPDNEKNRDIASLDYACKCLLNDEIYFSVGINCAGIRLMLKNGKYLYEDLDVLHVSILSDAPYNLCVNGLEVPSTVK